MARCSANCLLWLVEQLVTRRENTEGLPRRPVLLHMGTVSVVLLKADAPAEATRLCPAPLASFTMCTGILALWMALWTWAGPHHAWGAQTVRLLLVKGLKSVSAKLFKKSPQLQQSSVLHDKKKKEWTCCILNSPPKLVVQLQRGYDSYPLSRNLQPRECFSVQRSISFYFLVNSFKA